MLHLRYTRDFGDRVRHIRRRMPDTVNSGRANTVSGKDSEMNGKKKITGTAASVKVKKDIPFYEKYMLTIEEACVLFHIGEKKMRELMQNHQDAKWMLYSGRRAMVKRELFAAWLDRQTEI